MVEKYFYKNDREDGERRDQNEIKEKEGKKEREKNIGSFFTVGNIVKNYSNKGNKGKG